MFMLTPIERRKLAWAMFESIPWEHRLDVTIIRGMTWAGSGELKGDRAGGGQQTGRHPSLNGIERDNGGGFGRYMADQQDR